MLRKQTIAVLGAAVLALGLAGSAGAASDVEVTYDLSDTTFLTTLPPCSVTTTQCVEQQLLSGSMKVRYASDSQSSMPILHGPATLLSWTALANIQMKSYQFYQTFTLTEAIGMKASLISPVVGSLLSGGTLTFGSAQVRVTGSRHCNAFAPYITGLCIGIIGTLTSNTGALGPFTNHVSFTLAATYGGAQSTRHTVSGTSSLLVPSKLSEAGGNPNAFATAVSFLGREILREAEGHDPKVIPEPGTLLLLGAGAAGLALVGHVTRRSRQG